MISNEAVHVSYDAANGRFTLTARTGDNPRVVEGVFADVRGTAKRIDVIDETFGDGQAIEVTGADGATGRIMLFPNLPFALLRTAWKNGGVEAQVFNRVPVASLRIAARPGAEPLTTLGTGGLASADQNPGSYAWLAVAEPRSRNGAVVGWLTHDRASGVLFPRTREGGAVEVEARADYGHLRLAPGQSALTETLAIGCFEDARMGLEVWADAIARVYDIRLPPQPIGFCTWYTEKHGRASDEKNIAALADVAARDLKPFGFNFVQIDDGWQRGDSRGNGPNKDFTDFDPQGAYPSGMKATADALKASGLTPGIWFMPFAGTHDDPWFAERQDWFVKRADGTPYDTRWGGTSLDMTNPAARDYLRAIVRRLAGEWGYTYFKMDGLYTGLATAQSYVNSGYKEDDFGDAVFADPNKTNVEAFRDGLKLVRETAGPHVFFLGCTVTQNMRSYGASIGLVDAMRIGPDNKGTWEGWLPAGPVFGSRNYFLNRRVWYNDPDPEYVRASLSANEARAMASWTAVAGQLDSNSDWIPDLPAERIDILRRVMPAHSGTARPVDLFENDPPRLWTVTDDSGRNLIALFNFADTPTDFEVAPACFGLPSAGAYAAFDYWENAFLPPLSEALKTTLPPRSCRILAVRPLVDRPFLLSTSRNVAQGMTEVTDEEWNERGGTLSGVSRIVAADPYELRVYASGGRWQVTGAELSAEGTIRFSQEGAEVRVTITAPAGGAVRWRISFAR